MNRILVIGIVLALAAGTARASEVIATAGGAPAPATPLAAPILIPDHADFDNDIVRPVGPCGGSAKTDGGKPDKKPHGAVFAGVGTGGYREGGGVMCVPLGDHAAATIAVDVGRTDGRGWRR